ncbi:MAG: DUF1009 domain-containing protein [Candidatus Omnitrophica bacterium]|nr:DUF1009 domain-containing protein [Candidatus Omnitrophota bacterium]MBD3268957.1 DUF1009 domain-containing protein [Candidatus Omnitrophota bacterium]
MKIGIIAGNRFLPILIAQKIRAREDVPELVAVCFRGETSPAIRRYVDRCYWLRVGALGALREVMEKEGLKEWIMAGQINPMHIFRKRNWDIELKKLTKKISDFRPHCIFYEIIKYLEKSGIKFLELVPYLEEEMAREGVMNSLELQPETEEDIQFGLNVVRHFVELDVGQTAVVKKKSVVALESLEGTDRTIIRGGSLAGRNCVIFKFCKKKQDLRFDVPVVGEKTLKYLKRVGASALVLEADRVIILNKQDFLKKTEKSNIAVIGKRKN